jgi:hypothetical protein
LPTTAGDMKRTKVVPGEDSIRLHSGVRRYKCVESDALYVAGPGNARHLSVQSHEWQHSIAGNAQHKVQCRCWREATGHLAPCTLHHPLQVVFRKEIKMCGTALAMKVTLLAATQRPMRQLGKSSIGATTLRCAPAPQAACVQ